MRAPSAQSSGRPSRTMAMSVVVPPMSTTIALRFSESAHAPVTLAAGPDKTVASGWRNAVRAFTSEPSPFTIISGARTPCRRSVSSSAFINSVM